MNENKLIMCRLLKQQKQQFSLLQKVPHTYRKAYTVPNFSLCCFYKIFYPKLKDLLFWRCF